MPAMGDELAATGVAEDELPPDGSGAPLSPGVYTNCVNSTRPCWHCPFERLHRPVTAHAIFGDFRHALRANWKMAVDIYAGRWALPLRRAM